jgi:hypothetical protein
LTSSGITGLTLPGMIEDPGCMGGRLISLRPQRGPEDIQRRSLQILDICTAARFMVADIWAKAPAFWVASTRLRARRRAKPLTTESFSVTEIGIPRRAVDTGTNGRGAHIDGMKFFLGRCRAIGGALYHHGIG